MMRVKVKCPYCGLENNIELNPDPDTDTEKQVVLCDDRCGCARYFAAFIDVSVHSEGRAIAGC